MHFENDRLQGDRTKWASHTNTHTHQVPELGGWSRERSGEADIERPNEKAIYNVCRSREKEREGQIKTERNRERQREKERDRERQRERDLEKTRPLWGIQILTFRVHSVYISVHSQPRKKRGPFGVFRMGSSNISNMRIQIVTFRLALGLGEYEARLRISTCILIHVHECMHIYECVYMRVCVYI